MKNPMQTVKKLQYALLHNYGYDFMMYTRQIYCPDLNKNKTFYNVEYFDTASHEKKKIYGTPSPYRLLFKYLDLYKALVTDGLSIEYVLENMAETEPTRVLETTRDGDKYGYAEGK